MAWSTSDRRRRLPSDWSDLKATTKARARNRCEASEHDPRCDGTGHEADHINPGDDHGAHNLQWLNHWCHRLKTARETAQRNREYAALRKRPAEDHPGRL